MKIVTVMPVDIISGAMSRLPGLVFFAWRNLQVARKWVKPRNPQSVEQVAIRNILTQCAQGFQSITQVQKDSWTAYGPIRPGEFYGKEFTPPEISMFVKVNSKRLIDAVAISNTAPTILADFVASDIASVAYNSGTTVLSFDVTHNASVVTNRKWAIYITASLPSGVYKVRDGDFRLAKGVATESIIPVTASPQTINISAPKFGNWSNGDYMAIRLEPLSEHYDAGATYQETNTITVT